MAQTADGRFVKVHGSVCGRLPISAGRGTVLGHAVFKAVAISGKEIAPECADQRCGFVLSVYLV